MKRVADTLYYFKSPGDEELMLALITDRRSRLRRSGVIRPGLQRSNVDPMPSGTDTNGHATASLTYAALVKDAYSQVPRGITKTRNSSVPPPTLPTEGKHSPSHRPCIPLMDNSSERAPSSISLPCQRRRLPRCNVCAMVLCTPDFSPL